MKVKDLNPAKHNPRKISDKKLDMLGKSMKEFGDLSGIIFNRRTNRLIGGHQRIKHLNPEWEIIKEDKGEGYIKTPFGNWIYREVDWDEKKEIAANIAANKHGGEFDIPALKDLIVEIDDGSSDIELIGFENGEISRIFKNIDYKPEIPITAKLYESYNYVLIFTDNIIDQTYLENFFNLKPHKSYKSNKIGITRVVHFKDFYRILKSKGLK